MTPCPVPDGPAAASPPAGTAVSVPTGPSVSLVATGPLAGDCASTRPDATSGNVDAASASRDAGAPARSARTRDATHFDRLYAASPDPWGFRTSVYERDKYRETLAALPDRRFGAALEVGCSIGELTRLLAPRCDSLLGLDLSDAALREATAACAALPGVAFRQAAVPADWPPGPFDLVVLSEVLYFLVPDDLARVARRCLDSLAPGGLVLLVNWTGPTDDPLSGDEAADGFIAHTAARLRPERQDRHVGYRLDLLQG